MVDDALIFFLGLIVGLSYFMVLVDFNAIIFPLITTIIGLIVLFVAREEGSVKNNE